MGGDEFLIASEGELGPSEIAEKLGHVQRALNSVDLDPSGRRKLRPGFSFGLAQGHEAQSVTALIALADQRLYVQKRTKKRAKSPPNHRKKFLQPVFSAKGSPQIVVAKLT